MKRIQSKEKVPGELILDETISYPLKKYGINVHNRILDLTIGSMKSRFEKHGDIYKDLACLSSLNFYEVMPSDALEKHSIALKMSQMMTRVIKTVYHKRQHARLARTVQSAYI